MWENSGRQAAPNGGVMRTSILGVHDFGDIEKVIENTKAACKVTHADPRCIASCVAVTTAVAMMLQGKHFVKESSSYDVKAIMEDAYSYACTTLETVEQVNSYSIRGGVAGWGGGGWGWDSANIYTNPIIDGLY